MNSLFESKNKIEDQNLQVKVLLSVRNPYDMIESEYQQLVKRHGLTEGIDEFAESRKHRCVHTVKASELIVRMESEGIPYALFNYSSLGSNIVSSLADEIGIGQIVSTDSISGQKVNRSLTASELQLVIVINQLFGKSLGSQLSTALVDSNPGLSRERIAFGDSSLEMIKESMGTPLEIINQRLESTRQLKLDYDTSNAVRLATDLTEEQLDLCRSILAKSL